MKHMSARPQTPLAENIPKLHRHGEVTRFRVVGKTPFEAKRGKHATRDHPQSIGAATRKYHRGDILNINDLVAI
jgi:hypothetical protein